VTCLRRWSAGMSGSCECRAPQAGGAKTAGARRSSGGESCRAWRRCDPRRPGKNFRWPGLKFP
jgi:hypothetical protein